jgi:hypothetical protein
MKKATVRDIIGDQVTDLVTAETEDTGKEAPRIREGDYVRSRAATVATPIPSDSVSEPPTHVLYEIIDDWEGWRIEVDGQWHHITYLEYNEDADIVSLLANGVVSSYDKDTPVLR